MRRWLQLSFVGAVLAILFLAGCARHPQTPQQVSPVASLSKIQKALAADNVQVLHVGEMVMLVLSSDKLFNPDSANLAAGGATTLQTVTDYINKFNVVNIAVNGYTDDVGDMHRNTVLSARQAQVVVKTLTSDGVDARLLVAKGFGQRWSIASNMTAVGRELNNRIEIQFQYLPPPQVI